MVVSNGAPLPSKQYSLCTTCATHNPQAYHSNDNKVDFALLSLCVSCIPLSKECIVVKVNVYALNIIHDYYSIA